MKRDNTPWETLSPAAICWQEGVPRSVDFGDIYYSKDDGLAESRYVFLAGNQLPARWQTHPRRVFTVGETGFGTGLNFLLTWQAWRNQPQPRPNLHYLSIEKHPLSAEDLARALGAWPELREFAEQLQRAYPGLLPGEHRLLFDDGQVHLDLHWGSADEVLADLAGSERLLIDAWYLDGFAPSMNSTMWQTSTFHAIAASSQRDATFATFTAAGQVRATWSVQALR